MTYLLKTYVILCSLGILCSLHSLASVGQKNLDFQNGVQAYQKADFAAAAESFAKALAMEPRNTAVLTNLGLVHFKLGHKGLSIAYLRQALSIDPSLSTAALALPFVMSQIQIKEIPHRLELYEEIRENFLEPVGLLLYASLAALTLLISGWLIISYFGEKRRAFENELNSPSIPGLGILCLCICIVFSGLSLLKVWDNSQARGTVVEAKISAQAAPGEGQAVLFELYEGLELLVLRRHEGWVQVTYPGGMTGWIPEKAIMLSRL